MIKKHIPENVNVAVFTTACHSGDAKEELRELPHNLLYVYGAEAEDTVKLNRSATDFVPSGAYKGKTAFQVATELMLSKDPSFSASTNGSTLTFAGIARTYAFAIQRAGLDPTQGSPGGAVHWTH